MNREDYKLYTWYPLTDDEYWVDIDYQDEFPDCQTIVCATKLLGNPSFEPHIMTYDKCSFGWGTMVKQGTFKFMIIEKPKND